MQPFDILGKSGAASFGLEAGMPLGFQHFDLVAATREEPERLAAAAIGVIRVMSASSSNERAFPSSGARGVQVGDRQFPHQSNVRARPSPVVASRAMPTVNILGLRGFVCVAPFWGLLDAPVPSRAFRFGEGSFVGPYNTALEPSRPTVGCYPVAVACGSARTVMPSSKRGISSGTGACAPPGAKCEATNLYSVTWRLFRNPVSGASKEIRVKVAA